MARAVAAHINAWGKRWPHAGYGVPEAPATKTPITFPTTKLRILVEILLAGEWVDISRYVMYEQKIVITRGRRNEQTTAGPSTCLLRVRNSDRRFSPRNPTGPHFGLLVRNTKIRISVDPGNGMHTRFTGFIPEWPPTFITGEARWVSIRAMGILRRLQQGVSALRSPMRYSITAAGPIRYWPMEDASGATRFASGLPGKPALFPSGEISYASDSALVGSKPLPVFSTTTRVYTGLPTAEFTNSRWQVDWFMHIPEAGVAAGTVVMRTYSQGGVFYWEYRVGAGAQQFVGISPSGTTVVDSGAFALSSWQVGEWNHVRMMAKDAGGGSTQWALVVFPISGAGGVLGGTTAVTWGGPTALEWGEDDLDGVAYGQVSVWDAYDFSATDKAARGYGPDLILGGSGREETATARFARVCTELGIDYAVAELVAETEVMGPQTTDRPLTVLQECEATAEGLIDEDFDGRLRLASRTFRYNQQPALRLTYDGGELVRGFQPTDDDLLVVNDETVTRDGGTSAQVVQETGPLSVQDPPDGVGRYDNSHTLSLGYDTQVHGHAAYRVARGTVDEPRFPAMPFDLAKDPHLIEQWLACDIGSRMLIDNPPDDIGPNSVDQILEGYTEELTQVTWQVSANGAPAAIFDVAVLDDDHRLDCGASALAEDLDTSETGIDLTITDACVWAHDDGDYVITVGAEDMLVTAVGSASGGIGADDWSWTQTLTVTRSYNGVVTTHAAGAEVRVKSPVLLAL
jgi:hypothetical protein